MSEEAREPWAGGMVGPGDRVWVPDPDDDARWVEATFVRPGDPADAVHLPDPGEGGSSYERDVGWVRFEDGTEQPYRHEHIRERPPT